MKFNDKIKSSFLGEPAQANNLEEAVQTETAGAGMKSLEVLDKAVDVLEQPGVGDEPAAPSLQPPKSETDAAEWRRLEREKNDKRITEVIEAERVRKRIREQTRQLFEQRRQDEEKARLQRDEAERAAKMAAEVKASSWDEKNKLYRREGVEIVITRPLLKRLLDFAGLHGLRDRCAAEAAPFVDAWEVAFNARVKQTRDEFRRQLFEDLAENAQLLREGCSDLRPLPSDQELERQFSLVRAQCNQRMEEVAKQFNPVLLGLVDQLQVAARKLADETMITEKAEADSVGAKFEPSCVMKAIIAAGFDLRSCVERNWLASKLCNPRKTLHGLLNVNAQWA